MDNDFLKGNVELESSKIHDGLFVIRIKKSKGVIGYVNFHPEEQAWFWFVASEVSKEFFTTTQEAMESLVSAFMMYKLDNKMDKLGLLNNEKFVKK